MRRCLLICVLIVLGFPVAAAAQDPAPVSPFSSDALPVLIQTRTDLELLANQHLGGQRPVGWSGSLDINDPQLALLLRLDLELLAGTLIAPDQRPPGWFGPVPGTAFAIARDARHDLELLADAVGQPGVRPNGWAGGDPLFRCSRALQTLVGLLERDGAFTLTVDVNHPEFCRLAELQAAQFVETALARSPNPLVNPAPAGDSGGGMPAGGAPETAAAPGSARVTSALAFGYLNRYATERVGPIPVGTPLIPIARSFTEFSRMTLVRGEGFELFVDHRDTTISEAEFAALADVNRLTPSPACQPDWCEPVTYTLGSPAAGRTATGGSAQAGSPGGRVKVPVEHLVIYYDGQDSNGTTLVRMQLCDRPTGQAGRVCQNVTAVFAPDGSRLASVGTQAGIAQYRLPYGYSTHTLYAASYYMSDMWIAAPGQR